MNANDTPNYTPTNAIDHRLPSRPRRHFLALSAGAAAGSLLPATSAIAADAPIATRPIPRTGERLPVVGLGTAIMFAGVMLIPPAFSVTVTLLGDYGVAYAAVGGLAAISGLLLVGGGRKSD